MAILASDVVERLSKIVLFVKEDSDRFTFRSFNRLNLYHLLSLQHRLNVLDLKIAQYQKNVDQYPTGEATEQIALAISQAEPLLIEYSE
jgi:hypothetical protein